jgi:polyvinyl alcohol dehydrogenase (cytochrome)
MQATAIPFGAAPGSSVIAGATIVGEVVYWGSGYTHLGIPGYTGNNKFCAFAK